MSEIQCHLGPEAVFAPPPDKLTYKILIVTHVYIPTPYFVCPILRHAFASLDNNIRKIISEIV